jgi:putative methionine-R-sulfoxide reductase with GAF domain
VALAEKSVLPQLSSGPLSLTRSIEDLTSYQYEADVSTQLEQVVTYLKNNPDVPGVILRHDGKFTGALSRWKIFEWLGRPYGIELYFRKPIKKLADAIMPGRELYPSTTSIDDAVQQALHRSPERRYDPLVVLFEDGSLRLLDMYVLLLAQSEQLANVNAMIQKQAEIGKVLSSSLELSDVLSLILEQMESIIPYQRASILLLHEDGLHFAASRGYTEQINMDAARELANKNPIFSKVMTLRQPIAIEDVSAYTDWPHIPNTTRTHSWLGLPLVQKDTILGMLSISRLQVSPFRADEIEAASIFSNQASTALYNARFYEKLQQVNQELSKQRKNLQEAVDELNHANVRLMRHARHLETSYQIGQQDTSLLSLKELLPRIVNILRTQFNYSLVKAFGNSVQPQINADKL